MSPGTSKCHTFRAGRRKLSEFFRLSALEWNIPPAAYMEDSSDKKAACVL